MSTIPRADSAEVAHSLEERLISLERRLWYLRNVRIKYLEDAIVTINQDLTSIEQKQWAVVLLLPMLVLNILMLILNIVALLK